MNFPFLSTFFNKNTKALKLPQSLLLKEIELTAKNNNLTIFQNITMYNHTQKFFIPLLIVEKERGILLFEFKDWSYDDLKNAKIEKATQQNSSKNIVAFEKSHDFIKRRFNELTHSDGVPIFNYLLMQNLNLDEYKHLDDSFKELLPEDKIMFNDSTENEILGKIMNSEVSQTELPSIANIMGTLLTQYAILDKNQDIYLASQEQRAFIDSELVPNFTLNALAKSGKTSSILLKVILEKLKNPQLHVAIIEPTILACDILKAQLLNTVEHAIIEIDLASIEILTPKIFEDKGLKNIDLIICDDSQLYSNEFLQNINSSKSSLILVETTSITDASAIFTQSFTKIAQNIYIHQANPYAKALQLISSSLNDYDAKDILVVCSDVNKENLRDDLKGFIKDDATILEASQSLIDQNLDNLLLSSYSDINSLEKKVVILIDICEADTFQLQYACNLSLENLHVVYEDECENIKTIREILENNKE